MRKNSAIDTTRRVSVALERLRDARLSAGITQECVASTMGMGRSSYSKQEGGVTDMSLAEFVQSCLVVGIDPAAALSDDKAVAAASAKAAQARAVLAGIQKLMKSEKDAWE